MTRRQKKPTRRYFKKLSKGWRCPGCHQLAQYVDVEDGRDWYLPHNADCPTLTDEQRATAIDDPRQTRP